MGYYEDQNKILRAIRDILVVNVSALSESSMGWATPAEPVQNDPDEVASRRVIIGKRSSNQSMQWPQVWIVPENDSMENMTFNEVLHVLSVSLYIGNKGANLEDLFDRHLVLTGAVYDAIMENTSNGLKRTLNETADDVMITNVEADYESERTATDFFQVSRVELRIEYHALPDCG